MLSLRTFPFQVRSRIQGFITLEILMIGLLFVILIIYLVHRSQPIKEAAHHEVVQANYMSFQTAIFFVGASLQISRMKKGVDNVPSFGSGDVDVNENGFPVDTEDSNTIGGNAQRCVNLWYGLLDDPPRVSVEQARGVIYRVRAQGESCFYDYLPDKKIQRGFRYDADTGEVVVANP